MEKIRVLIADDSGVYRSLLRAVFEDAARYDVVAAVGSGVQALEKLRTTAVDLLVLDLEMPELDGLGTLRAMRALGPLCKTLVFSSLSAHGAQGSMEALELGATDFITKPGHDGGPVSPLEKIRAALIPKVEALFPKTRASSPVVAPIGRIDPLRLELFRPKLILIGSSTGGPTVLEHFFSRLRGEQTCPIVIAQHMPPIFTATLAERLGRMSGLHCAEAAHGDVLRPDRVYVAPGDYHLRLTGHPDAATFTLDKGPLIQSVRPAVDPLFESAAAIFRERALALVLTGMGYDGRDGAAAVRRHGGLVGIQEKSSCTVFGMPGAVYDAGQFDLMGTPDELSQLLQQKAFGAQARTGFSSTKKVLC